jgi:integrase
MQERRASEFVFSGVRIGAPLSNMAMLKMLGLMGRGDLTVHGFRSTFATWAMECTDYPDGVREAALAHKYKSETTAAYQRGQKLEKRRILMKDWAQFLAGSKIIRFDKTG